MKFCNAGLKMRVNNAGILELRVALNNLQCELHNRVICYLLHDKHGKSEWTKCGDISIP
jgi:hypothetical protein